MSGEEASDLGSELMNLITRAVDGRILDEEVDNLRAAVIALTQDRREPVDKLELAWALERALPMGVKLSRRARSQTAGKLLQMTVVTKLPHQVWEPPTDG